MDFKKIIQSDREAKVKSKFEGNFLEYLDIIKADPSKAKLSHRRMYDTIIKRGFEILRPEENPRIRKIYGNALVKRYNFFKEDFFGIDRVLMKIVSYFYSASMNGEESRQVLYLAGPVGAGKSSLVEALKKAFENTEPVYILKGCPMNEEPLHLIPKHLRKGFEEMLGVEIEGDLCPECKYRLINDYKGEYENFPVTTTSFSIRSRKGIGVVPPVDPNNQDTSYMTKLVVLMKNIYFDLYLSPHAYMDSSTGFKLSPSSVKEYSTFGGTSS